MSTIRGSQQAQDRLTSRFLPILNPTASHTFVKPVKRIHEGHDVPHFLTSQAYRDIGMFVMQLNIAVCPRKSSEPIQIRSFQLDTPIKLSEPVQKLQDLLRSIDSIIDEVPPDTGPRRFGNVSFRKWYEILELRVRDLLQKHLPKALLDFGKEEEVSALEELTPYLMGGFGSSQRLDYGTGHELSFLAFLGCIWKLGGFSAEPSSNGELERSIVFGVIEPYLRVVRRLILTYTLEPAGSHGVWGLDDHSFISYIFGSSQYCPPITDDDPMPVTGALTDSPHPGDIAKKSIVDRERTHNMYFSAVGFINDVKTGPFWEHSPILFDISGVRSGWGKINKGMIKMYNAEVLSKFPVVQHFPFGSLFSWDQDPNATTVAPTVHHANQPPTNSTTSGPTAARPLQESTRAPWADPAGGAMTVTTAPWANSPASRNSAAPTTRAPWATEGGLPNRSASSNLPDHEAPTKAPWADLRGPQGR